MVSGFWSLVAGLWFLVFSFRFVVRGLWFLVYGLQLAGASRPAVAQRHNYMGNSLIINRTPLGPYSSPRPGALRKSLGEGRFLMREVLLHRPDHCLSQRAIAGDAGGTGVPRS